MVEAGMGVGGVGEHQCETRLVGVVAASMQAEWVEGDGVAGIEADPECVGHVT